MIKHENEDMEKFLDTTFKPITSPLNTLVNKNDNFVTEIKTTTTNDNDNVKETVNQYEPLDLYETCKMYLESLLPSSPNYIHMDVMYGIRLTNNRQLEMGNLIINVTPDGDFKLKNENYKGSLGLYELIFLKKPETLITTDDEFIYKKMLIETSAFRKNYDPVGYEL